MITEDCIEAAIQLKEDYCSLEVARELKEKGFPYSLLGNYYLKSVINEDNAVENTFTHAIAMKWLREKGIFIMIDRTLSVYDTFHYIACIDGDYYNMKYQETYEEAVETALKYALENLL